MSPSNESGAWTNYVIINCVFGQKVILLPPHPFKHLRFCGVSVVSVCVENGWLLKLIVSSAILSVLKVLVCWVDDDDKKITTNEVIFQHHDKSNTV